MIIYPTSQVKFSAANQNQGYKNRNYISITGYAATACGVTSGVLGAKKKIKLHKYFAYIAAALTALHIGIVEANKYRARRYRFPTEG